MVYFNKSIKKSFPELPFCFQKEIIRHLLLGVCSEEASYDMPKCSVNCKVLQATPSVKPWGSFWQGQDI